MAAPEVAAECARENALLRLAPWTVQPCGGRFVGGDGDYPAQWRAACGVPVWEEAGGPAVLDATLAAPPCSARWRRARRPGGRGC